MKITSLFAVGLLFLGGGARNLSQNPAVAPVKISGDYVEARTASVFAGACHYNSELVTTGRDAVMAWNITAGQWNGVNLAGTRVAASITSDDNLGNDQAARRCEIVIDSSTDQQAAALTQAIETHYAASLGKIISVRRAEISFTRHGSDFNVDAAGFAKMEVQGMPNDECCKQPSLVWYTPLIDVQGRKVGFTQTAAYEAGTIGDTWERSGENSAFYGTFSY